MRQTKQGIKATNLGCEEACQTQNTPKQQIDSDCQMAVRGNGRTLNSRNGNDLPHGVHIGNIGDNSSNIIIINSSGISYPPKRDCDDSKSSAV